MPRQLLSINRSPIRSPLFAPIHSALSGNPVVRRLQRVQCSVVSPVPIFPVVTNAETPGTPAYYFEASRAFRVRTVAPEGVDGSIEDTMAAVTLYPSTLHTGVYGGIGEDDIFNKTSYETTSVSDEWNYGTMMDQLLAWMAAVDFSPTTGIWSSTPRVDVYDSAVYNCGSGGTGPLMEHDGLVTDNPLLSLPPLPAFNGGAIALKNLDVTTIPGYMAGLSAIPFDGEIYRLGAIPNRPSTNLASDFSNSLIPASVARIPVGSGPLMQVDHQQVKFLFDTPYFIFESTLGAPTPAVRFVGYGTAADGDIVDLPVSAFAPNLPAISNGIYVPGIETWICYSGQTWADFLAAVFPGVMEITDW